MIALAVASLAVLAMGAGVAAAPATASPRTVVPHYRHVVLVVMENLGYAAATSYPGYQALAHRYASASDSYAASHPSLPNYLDLVGGSTFEIGSDCTTCYVRADNLGAQLSAHRLSWGDYSEGVPGPCFLGPYANEYAGKHNPFRYFTDIRRSRRLCKHLLPLGSLTSALARHPSAVPSFSFVTPNMCHDGHDCSPDTAFRWLAGFVATVTGSPAWKGGGLLVVTWDESDTGDSSQVLPSGAVVGNGGGHVATLLIAPGVPQGTVVTSPVSDASLLATVEHNFRLPYLLGASRWAGHTLVLP